MDGLGIILAVLILIIIACAAVGIWKVKHAVRKISRAAFGTDSFLEGMEQQELLYAETPKSVAGMTNLCLPRIERDFPDFQWPQWRQNCEMVLKAYLQALDRRQLGLLTGASEELKLQTEQEIAVLRRLDEGSGPEFPEGESDLIRGEGRKDRREPRQAVRAQRGYERVQIHQTEITRYEKGAGKCMIVIQSSVGYWDRFLEKKVQTRFHMELVYIQDMSRIKDDVTAVGSNCPNCGAPIRNLGKRICEYCGSALELVDLRIWKLHRIEEEGN